MGALWRRIIRRSTQKKVKRGRPRGQKCPGVKTATFLAINSQRLVTNPYAGISGIISISDRAEYTTSSRRGCAHIGRRKSQNPLLLRLAGARSNPHRGWIRTLGYRSPAGHTPVGAKAGPKTRVHSGQSWTSSLNKVRLVTFHNTLHLSLSCPKAMTHNFIFAPRMLKRCG